MSYVFISYSKQNKDYVYQLADFLMEQGFDVWIDYKSLKYGDNWWQTIENAIENCLVFIPVMSPEALKSKWVDREVHLAIELDKLCLPILYLGKRWGIFITTQYADCTTGLMPDKEFIKQLSQYIPRKDKGIDLSHTKPVFSYSKPIELTSKNSAQLVRDIIGGPFEWCKVLGGEFLYGENKQELNLPTFFIAKYPVTYHQFKTFIQVSDGMNDKRWWDGLAEIYTKPFQQKWRNNNHPREMVNWYQAMAFCRWLSYRLGGVYSLDNLDEWLIRLPTEFEWEKAASGKNKFIYPYGNEFCVKKCNSALSNIKKTTPVNQYPQGESFYGVLDMSGNIWEWCLTEYDDPQVYLKQQNLIKNTSRVLRGGSYLSVNTDELRVSHRDKLPANQRHHGDGFRIACSAVID